MKRTADKTPGKPPKESFIEQVDENLYYQAVEVNGVKEKILRDKPGNIYDNADDQNIIGEIDDNDDEITYYHNSGPASEDEGFSYVTKNKIDDLRAKLREKGFKQEQFKFRLFRVNDNGQADLVDEFYGEPPEYKKIAEKYRHGKYVIEIRDTESSQYVKGFPDIKFTVPERDYPILKPEPEKIIQVPPPAPGVSADISALMQTVGKLTETIARQQENALLTEMREIRRALAEKPKSDMDELEKFEKYKKLFGGEKESLNTEMMRQVLTATINMAKDDHKADLEGQHRPALERIMDRVITTVEKIPFTKILEGVQTANANTGAGAKQLAENNKAGIDYNTRLAILINELVVGFQSEPTVDPDYFAGLIFRLSMHKELKEQVLVFNNDMIIGQIKLTEYKKYFDKDDADFVGDGAEDYLKDVFDKVRALQKEKAKAEGFEYFTPDEIAETNKKQAPPALPEKKPEGPPATPPASETAK